ncbi:unnamed protein product, partial [Allacma fusca]
MGWLANWSYHAIQINPNCGMGMLISSW